MEEDVHNTILASVVTTVEFKSSWIAKGLTPVTSSVVTTVEFK